MMGRWLLPMTEQFEGDRLVSKESDTNVLTMMGRWLLPMTGQFEGCCISARPVMSQVAMTLYWLISEDNMNWP